MNAYRDQPRAVLIERIADQVWRRRHGGDPTLKEMGVDGRKRLVCAALEQIEKGTDDGR